MIGRETKALMKKDCCLDVPSMNENTKGVKMTVLYFCIVKMTYALEIEVEIFL